MSKPAVEIVVAMTRAGVIGRDGGLPWPRIKADMEHFRRLTEGHAVIMGRKTWDSLPVRPLPARENIVVTRARRLPDGVHPVLSPGYAIHVASFASERIFVIGGADIYRQFLPMVDTIHLTIVERDSVGDTVFPYGCPLDWPDWRHSDDFKPSITFEGELGVSFYRLERRR